MFLRPSDVRTKHIASRDKVGKTQRRKIPIRIRYFLVSVVLGWAVYHYLTAQYPELQSLERTHATLTKQIINLQTQQTSLKNQITELHSKAYIAAYATKHFNLILPGQVSFDLSH